VITSIVKEDQKFAAGSSAERSARPTTHWFKSALILLIVLLFSAPLAFGCVEPWGWATLAVAPILLLLCWGLGCVQERKARIRWSWCWAVAVVFLSLGTTQLMTAHTMDRVGTREALIKLTADLLIYFLTVQLFDGVSRRVWHRFGLAVVAYGSSVSLFAILQFFSNPELIYWTVRPRLRGYVFGPYVNRNHYAGLMEMLIPLSGMFVLLESKDRPWRWIAGFAMILCIASVPLSGSRAGSVSVLLECVAMVAILGTSRMSRANYAAIASIAMFLSYLLLLWIAPPDVSRRLETIVHSSELSYSDRVVMARDGLRMFEDHPWFGVGLGSFATVYPRYQNVLPDAFIDHAHNDYVEVLAETGIVGGGLISASLFFFLAHLFSAVRRGLIDQRQWIGIGAAIGCCGLLCHSFADFNFHIPANAAWFAFSAGLAQFS
jgi:O-antigen ligase